MRLRWPRARAAALAAALAGLFAASAVRAGPVTLDAKTMRSLAFAAEEAGALDAASAYAEALLTRDPADVAARIVASRVARARADYPAARMHARLAWAASTTPRDRYASALARAQALASGGQRTAAMFWLRRAATDAPTPAARAIAASDFAYVRMRNPLSVELTFAAAPSSNVNNGSRFDTITLFGTPFTLSPAARALAGGTASVGATLGYRLAESAQSRTDLRAAGLIRQVWITDPAGAGVDAADFAYAMAEIGLTHRRRPGAGPLQLTFGATAGRNWYGGAPLTDYLRLEAGLDRPIAGGRHLILGLGGERQWRQDNPIRDAEVLSLRAGVVQRLASGDRLRLDLTARSTASRSAEVSHGALALRASWDRAAPVMGVRVSMGLGAEGRDYGPVPLAPGGRRDLRLDAELSLVFERLDYLGFAPVLDLRAVRSGSTVPLYDGFDLGVSLGFRSVF